MGTKTGITRGSRRALALALCFALLGLAPPVAFAQVWEAQQMLQRGSSGTLNLLVKKGDSTEVADTVDLSAVARLVDVTQRLSPALGLAVPRVIVTKDATANAFVTLDKNREPVLAFNTEMLRMVGQDDDLTAAVVGHELGHLKANHLTEGAAQQGLVNLLGLLAGLAVDVNQAKHGVNTYGLGMQLGQLGSGLVSAKFNRDQEREADRLGIDVMARAGFRPEAVAQLWRRMEQQGGGSDGLWWSSHPSHDEREQAMRLAAAQLTPTPRAVAVAPAVPTNGYAPSNFATHLATSLPPVDDPFPKTTAFTTLATHAGEPGAYAEGVVAYRSGQYPEALAAFTKGAAEDDERAMFMLGHMHRFGQGTDRDPAKATEQFRLSAVKGFAPAILALGDASLRGEGLAKDFPAAMRLFLMARGRGLAQASSRLSLMYLQGQGIEANPVVARYLAEEAAARNDAIGKAILGAMLRDGTGGPADPAVGFQLLSSANAALPGNAYTHFQLATAYESGIGTEANRTLALYHYRRALALGATAAKTRMNRMGVSD